MCVRFKRHRALFSDPGIYLGPRLFSTWLLPEIYTHWYYNPELVCAGNAIWLDAILAQKIICM